MRSQEIAYPQETQLRRPIRCGVDETGLRHHHVDSVAYFVRDQESGVVL